jgi:hypothetical protein
VKPTGGAVKKADAAAAKAEGESPAAIFERVAGAVWIPPSRADLKEKLGKK